MKKSIIFIIGVTIFQCISWNSLIYSQDETPPPDPTPKILTPDVKDSPNEKIYNFTSHMQGDNSGCNYVNYKLTFPKDGNYEVYTFKYDDDADTVLKYWKTDDTYSSYPDMDDNSGEDNFSKIDNISAHKGETHYFRVEARNESENGKNFGICYECIEITEPKKFMICMYTNDFNNVSYSYDSPEVLVYNDLSIGNDGKYLDEIVKYNFNTIMPCYQLQRRTLQEVSDPIKPDRSFLDRALERGLDVVLTAPEVDLGDWDYDSNKIVDAIKYWDGHPAIIGHHIIDEPEWEPGVYTTQFDFIEQVSDNLIAHSNKDRYIDVLPLWVPIWRYYTDDQGSHNYYETHYTCDEFFDEWLNPYIEQCKPSYLVSDYFVWSDGATHSLDYGAFEPGVEYIFYHNQSFAKASRIHNLDYIPVVATWQMWRNSVWSTKTAKQYDFANNIPLFHGAKGLSYWEVEYAPNDYILGYSSWHVRTDQSVKDHLGDYHKKIIDHQDVILDLTYMNSYHQALESTISDGYNYTFKILDECDWLDFQADLTAQKYFDIVNTFEWEEGSPSDQIAISFMKDSEGNDYFWLLNKNYYDDYVEFEINFNGLVKLTEIFTDDYKGDTFCERIRLEACDAKLFKISKSIENNIVQGSVRLPENYTLTIGSGEVLKIMQNSELIVGDGGQLILDPNSEIEAYLGAKIIVENGGILTAGEGSNFTGVDTWQGIIAEMGSSVTLSNTTINNAVCGLYAEGSGDEDSEDPESPNIEITNSSFTDCENGVSIVHRNKYILDYNHFYGKGIGSGISLTYCNKPITGNEVFNYGIGIKLVSSTANLAKNTISNNINNGLYITGNGSKPTLVNLVSKETAPSPQPSASRNNDIINNGINSLFYARSQIYMRYSAGIYMTNGYNNVYSGANGTLPTIPCIKGIFQPVIGEQYINKVVVSAEMNYWGYPLILDENWGYFFSFDYNPFGDDTGYSIDYNPYGSERFTEDGPYPATNLSSNEPPSTESTLLYNAMRLELDDKYTPSIKLYEKIIEKYPDSEEYYVATARLPYVYEEVAEPLEQLFSTYDEAIASEEITNKKFFKQMKISTKIKDKKYDEAIALAEEMKSEATTDEEKALSDIDIAIANMMKNAGNKGKSTDHSSSISNLLAKLTGGDEDGEKTDIVESALPTEFLLYQNYPNPFNPTTEIRFALPIESKVKLNVYNINGQIVSKLVNGNKEAGLHTVNFDASNYNSGMYFYTLEANGMSITKKMILTK
ncbi:MAG: T9SS type A sorting domain-containing protein [Candidatus Delongbacteria bacterium]|nr:T9SS type A sorting domain-containing protein [Candidatus Delongbacteria bacterium]